MRDRAYEIVRNPKYDGYQRGLARMVYTFFDKKTGSGVSVNEQLAEELHKAVIKKFKRRKFHAKFKDIIWAADLAEMGSLSSYNRGVKYLLCAKDVFTKYTWVKPLKDKKGKTVLNGFIKTVNESKHKPNKSWVDPGREFYNTPMQKWLADNDTLINLTHNEGKSVVAERFIKALNVKTYKKMTANDRKPYLNFFNKLADQYNNNYNNSIGKKVVDAGYFALTEEIESSYKAPKLNDGHRVRITK